MSPSKVSISQLEKKTLQYHLHSFPTKSTAILALRSFQLHSLVCQTPAVVAALFAHQRAGISCWQDLRLHCSSRLPQPCAGRHAQMESVWDQTSVYAPRDTKDVCVMKVEYDARNRRPSCVSNFFHINLPSPASLATRGFYLWPEHCFILAPDVNECGFLVRPCSQRCMNTHGSYRCYCEPGYTLAADGYTCSGE